MSASFDMFNTNGKLSPWGKQAMDRFADSVGWIPFCAAIQFMDPESRQMTAPAHLWFSQAALAGGLRPPVTAGLAGLDTLLQEEGVV